MTEYSHIYINKLLLFAFNAEMVILDIKHLKEICNIYYCLITFNLRSYLRIFKDMAIHMKKATAF